VVFAKQIEKSRLAGTDPHASEIYSVSRKLAGFDASSNTIARFEHDNFLAGSAERARGRETRHSGADNNGVDAERLRSAYGRLRSIGDQGACCAGSEQA
jgi:hypothetical protein